MNIAVVDDSFADRAHLMEDIKRYARENTIKIFLTEHTDGEAFLASVGSTPPDAIFLDIYMDGMSGMDIAKEVHSRFPSCKIIFVTTSPAFAVQSYEVEAFHYMLKPYSYETLASVISKLCAYENRNQRFIKVKEGREWRKVFISEILYADYNNHYVQIHTENSIISAYMKFQELEDMLLVYREFLACYRCVVVNMDKIKKVDDVFFLLNNGEYVPINRKRVKEIKSMYVDYIFGIVDGDNENGN